MRIYRRRLPHRDVPGVPVFVTWRLWGSLPAERVFPNEDLKSGAAFVAFDRLLDTARTGPRYLRQPAIAAVVVEQIRQIGELKLASLHAFVVMPNHVHLLCTPRAPLPNVVRKMKGPTALRANRLLGFAGEPFWQPEYFDRMVRNDSEFARIRHYIEWNPVKAALVHRPEEFPWSSAYSGDAVSWRD